MTMFGNEYRVIYHHLIPNDLKKIPANLKNAFSQLLRNV